MKCTVISPHHGDMCSDGRVQSPNAQFTRDCYKCKGTGYVMKKWQDIEGWFDWEDTYEKIINSRSGGILVEVGCYLGRSLCCLGELVKKSGKPFKIVGVDHCLGSGMENGTDNHAQAVQAGGGSFAKQLTTNVRECGLEDTVSLLYLDSKYASTLFPDNSLSMVFLDAGHDYQSVKNDIGCWLPKVKIGGVLAGDDVGIPGQLSSELVWPGVKQAVDEMLPGWTYSPHDAWLYEKVR